MVSPTQKPTGKRLTVMSRLKAFSTICAASALALAAGTADAATITVASVAGAWTGWTGGDASVSVTDGNPTAIRWGAMDTPTKKGAKSGYDFFGLMPPETVFEHDQSIIVGELTHLNYAIPDYAAIKQATLQVVFSFWLDSDTKDAASLRTITSTFMFDHAETPNQPASGMCPNGIAWGEGINIKGCADLVLASTNPANSTSITIDGSEYRFDVTGFMIGDTPMDKFWTQESARSTAQLTARFTYVAPIPVPAAGLLLLGSLGALGALSRRRRSA